MAWSFNPFTGNLDLVGGGAVVFEGEVETFADLPETIGDPAVGASFLVRSSTGVWLVNRRQAGIWIRRNNTGVRATDWEYGGDYPVNSVNGQTGNVSLGSSDVAAEPIDYTVVTSATTLANGAKVAADTTAGAFTLTLPATPANGDTVSILDYAGTFDTNNLTIARNGSNIESLAEDMDCNIEDAAFSLVFVGSTVGWKVVPYFGNKTNFASPDPIGSAVPNTGAFTNLSASGTLSGAGFTNRFASPGPIGSTTPSTGAFTTLSANNGTLTASAPALNINQTWNEGSTVFVAAQINATRTASNADSELLQLSENNSAVFRFRRTGQIVTGALTLTATSGNIAIGSNSFWFGNAGSAPALLNDGVNTALGLRNGTNPMAFRVYNTSSSSNANYERGFMRWSSNVLQIGTEQAGSGSARNFEIVVAGSARITIPSGTGNVAITNQLVLSASGNVRLVQQGDGILSLLNIAQNSFDRLQFGGTTNAFPALKRSSTALQVRLADDSAYSVLDAQLRAQGTAPATTGATGTAGDIRYDADYIYVCTAANTWKRVAIATW